MAMYPTTCTECYKTVMSSALDDEDFLCWSCEEKNKVGNKRGDFMEEQEVKVSNHLVLTSAKDKGGVFLNDDTRDSYVLLDANDVKSLLAILPTLIKTETVVDYSAFQESPF